MGRYRRLLRNRNFALLWSGQTASVIGDGLTFVSLVWLAYELGGLTAGLVLTGGGLLPAILLAGGVMGLPGAIGAVHGGLSERSTSGHRVDASL